MITEIAGKQYKIILTDEVEIRLEMQNSITTIYAPANIDLNIIEQFVKNKNTRIAISQEVIYFDQPIQLFQQNYLLKIINKSTVNKVMVKNRTISIYCKRGVDHQKQLKDWQKCFILQQLSDLISYWEEELQILIDEVKLRAMSKHLYTIHHPKNLTFSPAITCLSIPELRYLTFEAIAKLLTLSTQIKTQYFPEAQLMQDQIAYTLRTCQQSN